MKLSEKLERIVHRLVDIVFWTVLALGALLISLAVSDYSSQQEAASLDRIHAEGMALGASMCRGGR